MADLLVMKRTSNHTTPEAQYRRGDVVDVFPDGQLVGKPDDPNFWVLHVQGVGVEKAKELLLPEEEEILGGNEPIYRMTLRRLRGLVDTAPQVVIDSLRDTGEFTTTVAQIKAYIRNKRTDEAWAG